MSCGRVFILLGDEYFLDKDWKIPSASPRAHVP